MRSKGAATNLRFKNTGKQALSGPPLVTLQRVPALDVKMLLRRVPRPPALTYVLLTYVLAMPEACSRHSWVAFSAPDGHRVAHWVQTLSDANGKVALLCQPLMRVHTCFREEGLETKKKKKNKTGSGGRGCLEEGRLGVPGQVWEFSFLPSFPSFPREKSQFKKCLGKRQEVPDILLPDIRGLLTGQSFTAKLCAPGS